MYKITLLLFASYHHPAMSQVDVRNYTAVVAEYRSLRDTNRNAQLYAEWIWDAAKHYSADIIIFPEGSLTAKTDDGSIVPNPEDKIIPYRNKTYDVCDPMYVISEAAAENGIYVVVNLFEHVYCGNGTVSPRFVYNTNVAFDRNGAVIARYRKYNVYDENVNKPDKAELSTFATDFGVTFGMFTCFDILFKTPAVDLVQQKKVKNVIFPTWWYGELPFLTAAQVQDGWSYSMNVNLFASGANDPEKGTTGSGIYIARKTKISGMYESTASSMLHGSLPAKAEMSKCFMTSGPTRRLNLLADPSIPESSGRDLDGNSGDFRDTICHNGFCCNFSLKYRRVRGQNSRYNYRAVAFRGGRRFGANFRHEVAYCALVLCTDGNCARKPEDGDYPLEFDDIVIDGDFTKSESFQMPTTLVWRNDPDGIQLLDTMPYEFFSYDRTDHGEVANVCIRLKRRGVRNLITFGIFGRKFD